MSFRADGLVQTEASVRGLQFCLIEKQVHPTTRAHKCLAISSPGLGNAHCLSRNTPTTADFGLAVGCHGTWSWEQRCAMSCHEPRGASSSTPWHPGSPSPGLALAVSDHNRPPSAMPGLALLLVCSLSRGGEAWRGRGEAHSCSLFCPALGRSKGSLSGPTSSQGSSTLTSKFIFLAG